MVNELPKRKAIRLKEYDYGQNGAYFVTICTQNRRCLFGATISTVVQAFKRYSTIEYTKMVKQGLVPAYEKRVWQRGYYDHVIRNQADYDDVYRYIENNPLQWELDELYSK